MHLLEIKNLSIQIGGQTIFDGLELAIKTPAKSTLSWEPTDPARAHCLRDLRL